MLAEPERVGVVGVGRMGALYARIVHEHPCAELCALVGRSSERVEGLARAFGVDGYANGDDAAMWREHPEIGAVIVATPEWLHLRPTLRALANGAHVLLEKPMASDLAEAREIAAAAEDTKRVFMLCHSLRFDPRFAEMQRAVVAGTIGDVRHMYGRRHADQAAAARILGRCHPAYWLTPHDVDIMMWITGGHVISVSAHSAGDGSSPSDALFADLRFSTGALGRVENSWSTPPVRGRTRWGLFDVWGTSGSIELNAYEQGLLIHSAEHEAAVVDTLDAPVMHGRVCGVFFAMVDYFLRSVMGGCRPLTGVEGGLATIVVAAAIERSLREGREIDVAKLCQ